MSKTAAGPWIPVSERVPEPYSDVLVCFPRDGQPIVRVAYLDESRDSNSELVWIEAHSENYMPDVTHWAEITPPSTDTDPLRPQVRAAQQLLTPTPHDTPSGQ